MSNVVTGDKLGDTFAYQDGEGTYVINRSIYASVVGNKCIENSSNGEKPIISVKSAAAPISLPEAGDVVVCRVTKIAHQKAGVEIISLNGKVVLEKFPGVIRKQDVRSFDVDDVKMHESFQPGDIVLAEVLSLGDVKAYFLTVAKPELGVIQAKSESGEWMVPISYCQMQCPASKERENRKVAKLISST